MFDLEARAPIPSHVRRPVLFSYGLGADSTAILLRYLSEPECRDFALEDLVVVIAHTGDEWPTTYQHVERHVLPRLRAARVRVIQAARRGPSLSRDGVVVLDDSTQPETVRPGGGYTLAQEMFDAGTVPQSGGTRLCSIHAKGEPLDAVIDHLVTGRPYRHILGFEAGECRRAERDARYNTHQRHGEYPLIEWGWDRQDCQHYIRVHTGSSFPKSACSYCPFALASKDGRARTLERFAAEPVAATQALILEHSAVAFNARQGLIAGRRLVEAVRATPGMGTTLERFAADLAQTEHGLYRVRRVLRPRKSDPTRLGNAVRALEVVATGPRTQMLTRLYVLAGQLEKAVDRSDPDHPRVWSKRRQATFPTVEEFHVVAPAHAHEKIGRGFVQAWAAMSQTALW